MASFEVRLLGPLLLTLDGRTLTGFESNKVRALLAYLAVEGARAHSREHLAALLWPEQPDRVARQNLRQALYALRQTLNPIDPPVLLVDAQSVQWNTDSDSWRDIDAFCRLLDESKRHSHPDSTTCHECTTRLEEALALVRGELLEGFAVNDSLVFEEWLLAEREAAHQQILQALGRLANDYEVRGLDERALQHVQRQIKMEPWREEAHLQGMRLLLRTGQRSAALAQYEVCRRVMAQELGTAPSREMTSLYESIRAEGVNAEAQAGATSVPGNLPAPTTSFIGREAEVAAIVEMLRSPDVRVLTITGPGGVGKTRVAIQAAHALASSDVFPDGVFFVDLAPLADPALVLSAITSALAVAESPGRPLLQSVLSYLQRKRLLLLLDNFEHLLTAAPLVTELVRGAPGLTVLVTSRTVLPLRGVQEFPLAPLALPDPRGLPPLSQLVQYEAVRLFRARAVARKPDFAVTEANRATVAEICRRLDGLPLAIELAAARIKVLPPAAMLAHLDSRLRLLAGPEQDVPARQRTLHAAISWSYDLLSSQEQLLFRRLAVFSGGWTLDAAEAMLDLGQPATQADDLRPPDVLELMTSLVDKSIVRQVESAEGEVRFTMLETIGEYASEALQRSGEASQARDKHALCYLALAEQPHGPMLPMSGYGAILARLDTEINNLHSALDWLLQRGWLEHAARLAGALGAYWDQRGTWSEGRRFLDAILRQPDFPRLPAKLQAQVLSDSGSLAMRQSDAVVAEQHLTASLGLFRDTGNTRAAAGVLNQLGMAALYAGQHAQATALLEEGLALAMRDAGDTEGSGTIAGGSLAGFRVNIALAALFEGNFERAVEYAGSVLSDSESNRWNYALACATLGAARLGYDDLAGAQGLFQEGLRAAQPDGYALPLLYCLAGAAISAARRGNAELGARLLGAFEANTVRLGWPLSPGFQALYKMQVNAARAEAAPKLWEAAFRAGSTLTLEQAVAEALQV